MLKHGSLIEKILTGIKNQCTHDKWCAKWMFITYKYLCWVNERELINLIKKVFIIFMLKGFHNFRDPFWKTVDA